MTEMLTLQIISKFLAFSVALQSLELLRARESFSEKGIWRWDILRKDFRFPSLLDFPMRHLSSLLRIQLCCAALLLALPTPNALFVFLMFFVSLLISIRWRGAFNGGADSMTLIGLLFLGVALIGADHPLIIRGALWYFAIQCLLSYFLSGLAKIMKSDWRDGKAFQDFLRLRQYGAPAWAAKLSSSQSFCFFGAWLVMGFELASPLSLLDSKFALLFIGAALVFHLLNFWLIGLNRFLWAWLAAYPALYFCSQFAQ